MNDSHVGTSLSDKTGVQNIPRWSFDRSHFRLLGVYLFVAMSIETLQQQTDQMLQQTAGALRQSEQQAAAASTAAGQSASSQSMSVVDTRLMGKPERWNGEDKSSKMEALPSAHDHLERAENGGASDSVLCAKLTQDEARHSRHMYSGSWFIGMLLALLGDRFTGDAQAAIEAIFSWK